MSGVPAMFVEPATWKKCLCPPCAIMEAEGCSKMAACCWIGCVCWPLNGILATQYITQPAIQVCFPPAVQQGYIFPPPEE